MSAIILDTEGTGLWEPDVIELAHVPIEHLRSDQEIGEVKVERFHPKKPITPAALAVHNIILEDLTGSPTWPGSWSHPDWDTPGSHYLIGHQVDFDWKAIGSPGGLFRIDILALCRFLWDELDSHKLGAMLYALLPAEHARGLVVSAHGAGADVAMTFLLLGFILDRAIEQTLLEPDPHFHDLYELSELARIPTRMTFGKYGPKDGQLGQRYSEVEHGYLQWMLRQADMDPYALQAARQALTARGF